MSYLNALITDLRDRKLWPIPLALLVALVAIPVLLSKSPAPTTNASPSLGLGVASTQTGPTVSNAAAPVQVPLARGGRDPFVQQKLGGAKVVMAANPGSGSTVTVSSSGATNAGAANAGATNTVASSGGRFTVSTGTINLGSSSGSRSGNGYYTGGTAGSLPSTPSAPSTPQTPAKPAAPVAGLTADESYQIQAAIPHADGGFTNQAYTRGSELPSPQQPRLVYLGVAQDGARALFAVLPGTMVSGGGTCVPGPLDCEILSVAPTQTVDVAVRSTGTPKSLGSFTLTSLGVQRWSSAALANKARNAVDARSEQLLARSGLQSLSLFPYNPSLGVVVDQRNIQVTAGGPSVVHGYAKAATYSGTLALTDRGGNKSVNGPQTLVVSGPPTPTPTLAYRLSLQLVPQALSRMLRSGLAMRVSSSARADGIITLSISRAAARRAHIRARGASVVIARGTVSKLITNGTVTLHLKLSRQLAAKLARLGHLQLTVRVAVVTASGQHRAVVAAASY